MFTVTMSGSFRRNAKRMFKANSKLEGELQEAVELVKKDTVPQRMCKHKLDGCFKGMFSIHIRPDCILIYTRNVKSQNIILHNIGSHADIMENRKWSKQR